jgi:hypothetical protein
MRRSSIYSRTVHIALIAITCAVTAKLHAQFNFHVDGREVQIHSFASQGFAYSNRNNYLTMKTSQGNFAFTDFGFNASTPITDKLRVGAQMYSYNVGVLGRYRPQVDWAVADYHFKDWFGVRGGKVKTVLGLFNDVQDMEFLHAYAILPQSVYPIDQRGETIAHIGGDIYGNIPARKLGALAYTAYVGQRPSDLHGGVVYSLEKTQKVEAFPLALYIPADYAHTVKVDSSAGRAYGADLRWNLPISGLLAGVSYLDVTLDVQGRMVASNAAFALHTPKDHTLGYYVEYTLGNLQIDGEYRRQIRYARRTAPVFSAVNRDSRFGYLSASYRLLKWLEVGTYHSRYYLIWQLPHSLPANHVFDQALTARFDLRSYLDLKVEGHFIDGNMMASANNRGFYPPVNPNGVKPTTNLLVIRLGLHL